MNKNLILCYSDQHIREFGSFRPFNLITDGGLTGELDNIILGFHFVADQIRELKPGIVAGLGDLFQTTEFQSARVLHAADICLSVVKKACDEVGSKHYLLAGNHDILNENHMITSLAPFKGYAELILKPQTIEYEGKFIRAIPAISDPGKIYNELTIAQDGHDLIWCHQDFLGCNYENGHSSTSVLSPNLSVPALSGDIHLAQKVGNVFYVGSLIQHKFYKNNIDRAGGILTYDLKTSSVKWTRNNLSRHYVKVRELADLSNLNSEEVVIQVVSEFSREEIAEYLKDEWMWDYVRAVQHKEAETNNFEQFSIDDPKKLLKTFVKEDRPEAIQLFNEVIEVD